MEDPSLNHLKLSGSAATGGEWLMHQTWNVLEFYDGPLFEMVLPS